MAATQPKLQTYLAGKQCVANQHAQVLIWCLPARGSSGLIPHTLEGCVAFHSVLCHTTLEQKSSTRLIQEGVVMSTLCLSSAPVNYRLLTE